MRDRPSQQQMLGSFNTLAFGEVKPRPSASSHK
jgi:hypothetical protein